MGRRLIFIFLFLFVNRFACFFLYSVQCTVSLRENVSVFLIVPSSFNKQKKCRYKRTFKERNHLA